MAPESWFQLGLMAVLALGGMVMGVIALLTQRRTISEQRKELLKLAMSKPFSIIDRDERGNTEIKILRGRIEHLEATERTEIETPVPEQVQRAILEKQWADEQAAPIPSMSPDDVPRDLGELR